MSIPNVTKAFDKFGKYVVQQSRTNLTKKDKNATKELYNSLGYKIKQSKNSFEFSISMEDYGLYIDRGVKGVGGTKADGSSWDKKKVTNNDFKYRNKRPPAKVFNGWVIKRGIAPRSKTGQFTSRKSVMFAIAESVYHTGLETTNFFSLPFERGFKNLPDEIVEAYGLDMEALLQKSINN